MKKLKVDKTKRNPLLLIKEKWQDESFRKKADNYLFFGLLIVLVIVGIFTTIRIRNRQSIVKLNEAVQLFSEMSKEENPNAPSPLFLTNNEKFLKIIDKLNEVIDKYKMTRGERMAVFYKGVALIKLGNYRDAVNTLQVYLNKYKNDHFYPIALLNMGAAHEYLKEFEKAEEIYKKGIERYSETIFVSYFVYFLSLVYEVQNKMDEAVALAEKYRNIEVDNQIKQDLDKRLSFLLSL